MIRKSHKGDKTFQISTHNKHHKLCMSFDSLQLLRKNHSDGM